MAPAPTHIAPHTQLCRLAIVARRRGLSFAEFWSEAIREGLPIVMTNTKSPPGGAVRWPTDKTDRDAWIGAITSTRDSWRRSYEGDEQPVYERALGVLGDGISALESVSEDRATQELGRGMAAHSAVPSAA